MLVSIPLPLFFRLCSIGIRPLPSYKGRNKSSIMISMKIFISSFKFMWLYLWMWYNKMRFAQDHSSNPWKIINIITLGSWDYHVEIHVQNYNDLKSQSKWRRGEDSYAWRVMQLSPRQRVRRGQSYENWLAREQVNMNVPQWWSLDLLGKDDTSGRTGSYRSVIIVSWYMAPGTVSTIFSLTSMQDGTNHIEMCRLGWCKFVSRQREREINSQQLKVSFLGAVCWFRFWGYTHDEDPVKSADR